MKSYGFTKSDWALIWSHLGFRIFLRFNPSQLEVERAGMELLEHHHDKAVLA